MICFKVGQPWITNLRVMWTDGWVMSKCTQGSQKVCFLYLISAKNSIFGPSAKIKICTLSKAPPPAWPHQHTHKTSKNFTYGFVLGPLQFPVYRPKHTFDLKSSNFGYAGFQEKFDTPPLKPAKTEPSFRKLNSPPTKLHMLFPAHLQARELCPQTYSLSLPLEWSQVTHIPTSIKSARSPKSQHLGQTTVRWHPSSRMALCLSTTLTNIQAHSGKLCTHK